MARRSRTTSSSRRPGGTPPPASYSFEFFGFHDGWYLLQADMTLQGGHMEALAFEGRVTTWLIDQRITPGTWSHIGSGNTGDYPLVLNEDGSGLCLLLKRPADVLRACAEFPCTGVSIEALHAAVQAEASVHRFVIEDAARIIHDAIRRLNLTFGDAYPTWDDLGGETRVAFTLQVRHRVEHPDEPIEHLHETWVQRRLQDGWRLGARLSEELLTDPLLVPWRRLSERAQSRYRLLVSVIAALTPLLN